MAPELKYSRQWLIKEVSRGKKKKYIFFWGRANKNDAELTKSCLSQWWASRFVVKKNKYTSAEHWMMAEKARLFQDNEMEIKILQASKPATVKAFGRQVKNFDETLWKEHRSNIVIEGNFHKFSQNPDLKKFLLNTKKRILVEASPFDKNWGIDLEEDHEHAKNPRLWKGENLLGFALMEVRDRLAEL